MKRLSSLSKGPLGCANVQNCTIGKESNLSVFIHFHGIINVLKTGPMTESEKLSINGLGAEPMVEL